MQIKVYVGSDFEGEEALGIGRHFLPREIEYTITKCNFNQNIKKYIFFAKSISGMYGGWIASDHISKAWLVNTPYDFFLDFMFKAMDKNNGSELKEMFDLLGTVEKIQDK